MMMDVEAYQKVRQDQFDVLFNGGSIEESLLYEQFCELTESEVDRLDTFCDPNMIDLINGVDNG